MVKFRQIIGNFIYARRFKKRNRKKKWVNLNDARTLGVVFKVTTEVEYRKVKDFIEDISYGHRKVLVLGFVDKKGIPAWCVEANSGYFFDRQSLNWWRGPKNDYLVKFLEKDFDLLIDLTREEDFTTRYLVGLSRATFKAGLHRLLSESYLDLMIELKKDAPVEELTKQLKHYLTLSKK